MDRTKKEVEKQAKKNTEPDQSGFNLGVRDLPGQERSSEATFNEVEDAFKGERRDVEESHHDEGGRKVFTQGDSEAQKEERLSK